MGHIDIRFVYIPKAELKQMWRHLSIDAQTYALSRMGHVLPLLDIELQTRVMQALAHFWCPYTTTFILGKHELTPTLEEYSLAIGKPLSINLICPCVEMDPIFIFVEFLKISENKMRKILKGNCHMCPFSFLVELFYESNSYLQSRIFILAFFRLVIFSLQKDFISLSMAWIARQVCSGMNFTNAILTETFISLTRFKQNKEKTFHAPVGLLQMWFFSHYAKFGSKMTIPRVSQEENPITKFQELQKNIARLFYSKWIDLFKDPSPKVFLWQAIWFQVSKARLYHGEREPILLLGITDMTQYHPLRVVRQYGVLQDIPPPLGPNTFQVEFVAGENYRTEIKHLDQTWVKSKTRSLSLPKEKLEGKEKCYHTKARYIKYHLIPTHMFPKFPLVIVKPTRQAEIETYAKKT
ncbi:uncharacterized protein J3R85_006312 [Psidium guajava]|nr:uncharacterized protein J3R85_006312 [Psidium guajava]